MMKCRYFILAVLALLCLGCETIKDAESAKELLVDKASGKEAEISNDKVNLVGLSLEELVEFAMTNRETLVSAELKVKDSHLAIKQLRADAPLISPTPWTTPKVNASLNYGESSEQKQLDHIFNTSFERGKLAGAISVDLLVYDFGRYDAKYKSAAENVLAAELALQDARYDVFEEVASAYFSLLEARSLLVVAETAAMQYALHLDQAREKYEQGEAKKIDVTKAALDLSEARDDVVAAENAVETSGAELVTALGLAADQATWKEVLSDEKREVDSRLSAFKPTDKTAVECFDLGCTNYPAMQIARARLRSAMNEVDYTVADLKPSLSLTSSLNFSDPYWWWKWGVGATQNLFSGFRKTTAVDRAVIAMETAATEVDRTEHQLSLAVSLAVAERDNAKVAYATSEESVINSKAFLDLAEQQYQVGDISRVDFQDSVVDYAKALSTRVKAFYRGQKAEAKLFRLIGEKPTFEAAMKEGEK